MNTKFLFLVVAVSTVFTDIIYTVAAPLSPATAANTAADLNTRMAEYVAAGGVIPPDATTEQVLGALQGHDEPGFVKPSVSVTPVGLPISPHYDIKWDNSKRLFTVTYHTVPTKGDPTQN